MSIEIFKFTQDEREYTVVKTAHVYEVRHQGGYPRDKFVNKERYKEIIHLAMMQGLTSFRSNTKVTAISFYDYQGKVFSLLVSLNEDNLITVISVYQGYRNADINSPFRTADNRINLMKYILPYMNYEKQQKNQKEKDLFKIENECIKEDYEFIKAMKVKRNKRHKLTQQEINDKEFVMRK